LPQHPQALHKTRLAQALPLQFTDAILNPRHLLTDFDAGLVQPPDLGSHRFRQRVVVRKAIEQAAQCAVKLLVLAAISNLMVTVRW